MRYDYAGGAEFQLTVKQGACVDVLDRASAEWWYIRKADGELGYVPANYVHITEDNTVGIRPEIEVPTQYSSKSNASSGLARWTRSVNARKKKRNLLPAGSTGAPADSTPISQDLFVLTTATQLPASDRNPADDVPVSMEQALSSTGVNTMAEADARALQSHDFPRRPDLENT